MGIVQFPIAIPVTNGSLPSLKFMISTDAIGTVTAAGYLNSANVDAAAPISNTDVIMALYSYNLQSTVGTFGIFTVTITNGVIQLVSWANPGDVLLPVSTNHIAQFNGTSGQIYDGSATAIHGGSIQAGLSGTAGTLISYPGTASKGSLIVAGVANTGNTNTTISNAAMGQASVVSIPDPGGATADFVLAPSALVNNNLVKASGTAGLIVDAGFAAANVMQNNITNTFTAAGRLIANKVNGTEASNAVTASGMAGVITTSSLTTSGGSSYAITWTNTFITATSVVLLSISGGTNPTQNITFTCAPGSGTATLTIYNNTAATALNGTILISYLVI
jgi:hypothetical protein